MQRGHLLQQVVRTLERVLSPTARVVSPFRIPDHVAGGRRRDIDVYVEHQVAGETIRVIIECRDHKRKVGKGYVEQVAQKSLDMGRPVTHIVSASGFTDGAIGKARAHGIFLSTVQDVQATAWPGWILGAQMGELVQFVRVHGCGYLKPDSAPPPTPLPVISPVDPDSFLLYDEGGTPVTSLSSILRANFPASLWEHVPGKPRDTRATLRIEMPPGRRHFLRNPEAIELAALIAFVHFGYEIETAATTFSEYRSRQTDGVKAGVIRTVLADGTVVQLARAPDGRALMTAVAADERAPVHLEVFLQGKDRSGREQTVVARLRSESGPAELEVGTIRRTD